MRLMWCTARNSGAILTQFCASIPSPTILLRWTNPAYWSVQGPVWAQAAADKHADVGKWFSWGNWTPSETFAPRVGKKTDRVADDGHRRASNHTTFQGAFLECLKDPARQRLHRVRQNWVEPGGGAAAEDDAARQGRRPGRRVQAGDGHPRDAETRRRPAAATAAPHEAAAPSKPNDPEVDDRVVRGSTSGCYRWPVALGAVVAIWALYFHFRRRGPLTLQVECGCNPDLRLDALLQAHRGREAFEAPRVTLVSAFPVTHDKKSGCSAVLRRPTLTRSGPAAAGSPWCCLLMSDDFSSHEALLRTAIDPSNHLDTFDRLLGQLLELDGAQLAEHAPPIDGVLHRVVRALLRRRYDPSPLVARISSFFERVLQYVALRLREHAASSPPPPPRRPPPRTPSRRRRCRPR